MGKLTDEQKANLSEEVIAKAMQCETPEQLIELAKNEGIELTKDEAQAYLDEMEDLELDCQQLKAVAGGAQCRNQCKDNKWNSHCGHGGW